MLPPMEVALRMDRLRARLDGAGCDALLVTSTTNIGYLTGFTGSAGLLWVDADRCVLVTDGRYRDQAPQEVASAGVDVEVQIAGADQRAVLTPLVQRGTRLGLEAGSATWADQRRFADWFSDADLVATAGLVEGLREIKDEGELARMEAAASIADSALAEATCGWLSISDISPKISPRSTVASTRSWFPDERKISTLPETTR